MRTLDRYLVRQLIPVWLWCLLVFLMVSCVIDLFGRLDEILNYHVPFSTILQFYLNFIPMLFVQISPLALLLSAAFIATRMVRYQELLAMNAGGIGRTRTAIPFVFVGWLVSVLVFVVNERVVPQTTAVYDRIRQETFRGQHTGKRHENVATMDHANRLYHARVFDAERQELSDLTILEHDAANQPKRSIYAQRALFTPHGLLLLSGTVTHLDPNGALQGEPEPFVERLVSLPVTPASFREYETEPETMRIAHLHQLVRQLKHIGITNVRRYQVELASKVALPFMNLVVCLIAFVGSTRQFLRGHLIGLGYSLGWGIAYYVGVAIAQGIGKEGLLPPLAAVWLPHVIAVGCCVRAIRLTN